MLKNSHCIQSAFLPDRNCLCIEPVFWSCRKRLHDEQIISAANRQRAIFAKIKHDCICHHFCFKWQSGECYVYRNPVAAANQQDAIGDGKIQSIRNSTRKLFQENLCNRTFFAKVR